MKCRIYIAAMAIISLASCSKTLEDRSQAFPVLNPTKTDANAGNWRPILLSTANEFPLAAPSILAGTPNYILELNEIKSYQANLSQQQRQQINFWGAGAVLRWNEIMRTLVAQRNLPPYQNADGTYPFPNANNPLAYPIFPFANPPYAARAYAYLAAAQYDALVAAHFYKAQYLRQAPYKVDATIQPLLPTSDLPVYPSEDAVVMGASVEILKLLFPADIAYIQAKAAEHKVVRIMAGMNTRSDVDAGEALGKAVANKFIARARNDRAGAAAANPAVWAQFETDAVTRGETPWKSLELPARPPMLPLFGKVRAWLIDSAAMVSIRPAAPPSTQSQKFKDELNEVLNFSQNLTREQLRIAHFWADGIGTYTPPGHWNAVACEDFINLGFSEVRWARNLALLNMSLMDAAIQCWDTKYTYFNPRPSQMNPAIKSVTGVPNFPAYTSGHSTFSGAAATVLSYINPSKAAEYDAMAKEASLSRLYGAIHYRSDCEVGLQCGIRVGAFAVTRGRADGAD
ncbi:MAG: phosphatase PAP2 family protein [Bacteroidetes bacterium]|nr:MAG: phosphatase PAP2 family protein [Bacteroidota bacterium]TAE72616.1 MAG: phosphatase PAP2 family protein [Bacteroidota bacterium]TAF94166.1 MAG: phosphatase PAP2 family protein [Bacteroidota bacterium]